MDTSNIMLGIPADVIERLVNEFFDREQATWFLQTASFRATISGRSYQDHTSVTSAICMVATMYAPELRIYEDAFRARAYSGLGQTLASGQVLHVLQAHVLLGAHAFARGDFLTARSHASDASLLAYRSSLNLIRSAPSSHVSSVNMLDPVSLPLLPDPQNQLEEGERINAFWTVTIFDCLWGVALNDLPCLNGQRAGTDVLTPWPLDMWQYENSQDWIQTTQRDDDWLRSFLFVHPASDWATEPSGHLAVTAKAATLLECAARHCRDDAEFVANLDYWVDTLTTGLGPTAVAEPATYSAHLILRAVTFIAHYRCIPLDRSVNAAIALAVTCRVLHPTTSISQFGFLEPAIGIAIPAACRVLISVRAVGSASQGLSSEEVDGAIQSLVELLEAWANVSAFAGIQLERIMQERAAL